MDMVPANVTVLLGQGHCPANLGVQTVLAKSAAGTAVDMGDKGFLSHGKASSLPGDL